MNNFESQIKPFFDRNFEGLATSGALVVLNQGKSIINLHAGETFRFFDLASLTKVLFTTTALMLAVDRKLCSPETKVKSLLKWWKYPETSLADLLNHSSGLIWWEPFYEKIQSLPIGERREALRHHLENEKLKFEEKSVYSDVGFLLLSFVIEAIYKKDLFSVWQDLKLHMDPHSQLHFNPIPMASSVKVSDYAPTEVCSWRKKRLQAEVHDDNCWALGGVSTHAGLFGSADDVASWLLKIRSSLKGEPGAPLSQETVRMFTKRSLPAEKGDWALGFMMPTSGGSSSGKYFSSTSVGHTGFTGTSFWWDIEKDLIVILLSNRVFFGRESKEFAKLRPQIHDKVYKILESFP